MGEEHTIVKYVKNKMKIAVTGVIGSGKSTVMKYLKSLGHSCFDCDEYVHKILQREDVILEVSKHFDCLENGKICRKKLGEIVFNDQEKLNVLNSIIHPIVIDKVVSLKSPIFVDVPLLYETNMEKYFDLVIAVLSSEEVLVRRLKERNNLDENQAKKRINLQINQEIKKSLANYVIINNDTLSSLYKKIDEILEEIDV